MTQPTWPNSTPDEFGPFLAEQLRDPDVRAAYEAEQTKGATEMSNESPIDAADRLAPAPASREDATRHAWVRHYAAQALACYATLRAECRDLPRTAEPGSRPDIGYLALAAVSSTTAAVALMGSLDAPSLIWDLTPEAGALNGEWEDWLTETLVRYGVNPGHIDPDLDAADFAETVAGR